MLARKNTANVKALNDMNKTALYYASNKRTKAFGWQHDISNVMNYDQIVNGDLRSVKDKRMHRLQRKVRREEEIHAAAEARKRECKMPTSLSVKQEAEAREHFIKNRITKTISDAHREVMNIVNQDSNGIVNAAFYTHYKKQLAKDKK